MVARIDDGPPMVHMVRAYRASWVRHPASSERFFFEAAPHHERLAFGDRSA